MSFAGKVKVAREKLLETERAMHAYLHNANYDSDHARQLAAEIRIARDELLDQLLWPYNRTEQPG